MNKPEDNKYTHEILQRWNKIQTEAIGYFLMQGIITTPDEWVTKGCADRFRKFMETEMRMLEHGEVEDTEEAIHGTLEEIVRGN